MYILNHKRQIRNVSFEQFFRLAKYYFPPDSWWILSRNKTDVSFKKNPPKKKFKNKKNRKQTILYQTIKIPECQSITDPDSREMQNPPWRRRQPGHQYKLHNSRQGLALNSMQKGHTSHLPAERAWGSSQFWSPLLKGQHQECLSVMEISVDEQQRS